MLGHAKNLYEMYRFGKSVVNSKVFEKSLNKAKKNYQQKRKKQGKKLKRTKAGKRQLKEMKARQKATKQLWDGVTKMVQPLGKVLTSARKLANNLTKAELVKSVKKDMKKKVIQKQNCTLPVYVQATERKVASISSKEAEAVFRDFTQKYKTTKEARAALLKLKKYENTIQYKTIKFHLDSGRWESLIEHETIMGDIQGDPVSSFFLNTGELPRNPTLNFKNKKQETNKSTKNTKTLWDIKTTADKTVKYRFNGDTVTAYRDPKTGLWWAKDTTTHGGSTYKVFKEAKGGKELHWIADADEYGNFIEGKHKSNTGTVIKIK